VDLTANIEGINMTGLDILKKVMSVSKTGKTKPYSQVKLPVFQAFVVLYNNLVEKG